MRFRTKLAKRKSLYERRKAKQGLWFAWRPVKAFNTHEWVWLEFIRREGADVPAHPPSSFKPRWWYRAENKS